MDISIIVPTYNRKEVLKGCLDSLFRQDYPRQKYEVIVVDDSPWNGTEQMLQEMLREQPNLRYLSQAHKGPAAARNLGVREAQGEIIGFTDDDCSLNSDWVRLMVESHKSNREATVIGGMTTVSSQLTRVQVSQFLSRGAIKTRINGKEEVIFFPTCNVSVKKHIFAQYMLNEKFPLPGGEDLEFFWRLFKNGHRFIWDKGIGVMHYRDDTIESFVRQAYIYGRGNFLAQYIHRDQPLLQELKVGNYSFWRATIINAIKIPRFSYLLGKRLIKEDDIRNIYKKVSVYTHFALHKVFYLLGNIVEFFRIHRSGYATRSSSYHHTPRLLILDISHSCNLNCRICDIWKTQKKEQDIDISYIKKMLFQAKELGIREIALSGGEPLLRRDIFEILDYATGLKIKDLGILTNGILVGQYIDRLKPYLIDNTISMVVSLDSLKPGIHNHLRDSDSAWQKTTEALHRLSLLKKEYPQVNFNLISIILNQNLEELIDLAGFIKSLGADSLQFQPLLPNNLKMSQRKRSPFWVPEDRIDLLDDTIERLIEFKAENPGFIKNSTRNLSLIKKYYRATITSDDVECSSAYETVLVSNQGACTTCFSSYGDIKRGEFKEILQGQERARAHKQAAACRWPCLLPCFCD